MFNIKKFFKKIRKTEKKQNQEKDFFQEFFESDIQWSSMIVEEIFDIIKNIKKTEKKQEFIWNSFELIFTKNKVEFFNQFTQEKFEISLDNFEEKLKKLV